MTVKRSSLKISTPAFMADQRQEIDASEDLNADDDALALDEA